MEGRVFGERFHTIRLLKRSNGIDSWLAQDLTAAGQVVLKTLAATTVPRSVQHRLEHEANVLRDLDSRFLTGLLHVGREDGLLYFAVPFVPGITLEERLRRGPLPVEEAIRVGCCVLGALEEAHAQGVLHRDVKPANVIVPEADDRRPTSPAATLVDFGFARSSRIEATLHDESVGSVRYVSPEQAGLLDATVDERSDLYSFGALLFETLAGRPLFDGPTITEVLRQHMIVQAPDLRSAPGGAEIPRALDELLRRLLQKDPRDRYQSAAGALFDLQAIGAALAEGRKDPGLVLGLRDRRRTLTEPAFVGRAAELTTLASHVERARRGRGGLVLLEAESGAGKTRLLDELAQKSWRSAWILRGKGVAAEASSPFQMLSGVAAEIRSAAAADPATAVGLRDCLGDQRQAVCAALPELAPALQPAAMGTLGPEAFGQARTLAALARLLDCLGTPERPAVVILDDCQWADDSSLALLGRWGRELGQRHVLVIASFRSDEVPARHPLREIEGVPRAVLAPLDAADIRRLVESMSGALPAPALAAVEELSRGSPFMASAVVRGMVECEAMVHTTAGWQVNQSAIADVRSSHRAAAFLVRRVELLPAPVLDLLSVGAVLGREFDLDFAAQLADQSPAQALAALTEASARHMVWAKNEGARCVFVHDKVREALLGRLADDQRRGLHRQAASELEAQGGRPFDIAYHYDAAGEPASALPHALSAGDQARAQHALEVAEQQYRIAARGADTADPALRLCIAEGLGDVLMLRGRYDEAAAQFEAARELCASDTSRAQIDGKLGDLAVKRGDVRMASQALERGLRLLGRRVPRSQVAALFMCLWEVGVQALHSLLPRLFVGRRSPHGAEQEFLAIRLYSRLAHAYWFARGKIACAWTHLRELNLAERYPPSPELAQAYSEHAPVMTMLPWFERGITYAQRSLAIRHSLGDLWGQGQSLHFYGVVLYAASRYAEALEKLHAAVRLLERTGDRWELNTAGWHIAFCLYRLGYRADAAEAARGVHENGAAIGDAQAMGISLGAWAKATGGQVPRELVKAALERQHGDIPTAAEVMQAEALCLLAEGQPGAASELLAEADRRVREKGLRQEYVVPVLPWLATALRTEAELVPPHHPRRRRLLLRRAGRVVRRALRLGRSYRNNLPHALREAALLAAMEGRAGRARALLDESLAVAEIQGAQHEHAQSLLTRGRLGLLHGWPDAAAEIAAAEAALGGTGAPGGRSETEHLSGEVTLSLADRFDQLLEKGRRIASALSKETILAAVEEAAGTLLRGERCALIELGEGGAVAGNAACSQSIVAQAVATGKPVVVAEGATENASESLLLAGLRSVLCAPIFSRGRAIACLYVTHSRVGRLFGEEEERLAQFIVTLAGAALENAAGFARIEESLKLRDEFLAIASHELKTPLTPLQLQVDDFQRVLRRRGIDDDAVTQRLTTMVRQTTRLSELVENLLDLSRIAAGRLTLQPEEFDFAEMVRDVVKRLAPEAERLGCTLEVEARHSIRGRWDQLRLEQVVSNLLANAVKYGASHPIEIEVETVDRSVRLTMRDHGIGMSPKDAERVFERFERAVSVRNYGGLGLGLYITRQIVEAHGGQISVDSSPGQGATFTVVLPVEPVSSASSTEAA